MGSNYGKWFSNHRGREGEEEGGGGESLVNYGADAQQHLGVNALRTGAVISLTPSHLFTDSWAPSWGWFSVGFASVGGICKFKAFPLFPNGISLPPSLPSFPVPPPHPDCRHPSVPPLPADSFNCVVCPGSGKPAPALQANGKGSRPPLVPQLPPAPPLQPRPRCQVPPREVFKGPPWTCCSP